MFEYQWSDYPYIIHFSTTYFVERSYQRVVTSDAYSSHKEVSIAVIHFQKEGSSQVVFLYLRGSICLYHLESRDLG